jgi:hypothetical protein
MRTRTGRGTCSRGAVAKKLDKVADRIEAEWHANAQPSPYEARQARIQAHTERLLRQLVDLLRDNCR